MQREDAKHVKKTLVVSGYTRGLEERLRGERGWIETLVPEVKAYQQFNFIFVELPRPDVHSQILRVSPAPCVSFQRFAKERRDIIECVARLSDCFDEPEDRQITFVALKKMLLDLRDRAALGEFGLLRLLNMCIDALQNTRSELMDETQLKALQFVLETMNESVDNDQAKEFEKIMIKSGLTPIPDLKNIGDLYT